MLVDMSTHRYILQSAQARRDQCQGRQEINQVSHVEWYSFSPILCGLFIGLQLSRFYLRLYSRSLSMSARLTVTLRVEIVG